MQAIILAAGSGTRLVPLTITTSKSILEIADTSILEHNLDQLQGFIEEVFVVVNGSTNLIKEKIGNKHKKIKISYVVQKNQLGTADAAKKTLPLIRDKFLLLNGDDLYCKDDLKKMLKIENCILLKEVKDPSIFGQVLVEGNFVKKIIEKPAKQVSNLVNTGVYFLDKSVFDYKIEKSERGEYEFTDYIKKIISDKKLNYILAENWIPISYAWNLLDANKFLLKELKKNLKGKIEKNCSIKGRVAIGKNTIIKSGSYIEGPVFIGENCEIGPNCYIRPFTAIRDNCKIGQAVEVKNSVINNGVHIAHLSYVGDSIIGKNCNLAVGTFITNLRHNNKNIKSEIKDELIDTDRRKFGTVFGDNVKTGAGTIIYPGRKIWPDNQTKPGEIIKKDIR